MGQLTESISKEQIELVRALAEIIELIMSEPESYSVEYIQTRYLFDLAVKEVDEN